MSQNPFSRDRNLRRYVLTGGAVALVGYIAYQTYESDAYQRSKRYVSRLRTALQQYADALATGGEICSTLLRDLQQFLRSDGDHIPPSLCQVTKLLQSEEFTSTASATVAAMYRGVAGTSSGASSSDDTHGPSMQSQQGALDKVLDALLSDRGHSLVSVAVSMAAKNIIATYIETRSKTATESVGGRPAAPSEDASDKLFKFLSTPEGQQLAVMGVAAFANNTMRVYMEKSLEVNFYEDLFSSMAKPHHLEAVKQCVGVFARDVVAAYVHGGGSSRPSSSADDATVDAPNRTTGIEARPMDSGESNGAVSLAPHDSPGVSSSPGEHLTHRDDVDSDSLLHAQKKVDSKGLLHHKKLSSRGTGAVGKSGMPWISAVGKEWLTVSRDPDGRRAMVAIVGSATREAVAGMSSAVVETYSPMLFVAVLLLGVLSAVVLQQLFRTLLRA